MQGPDAQEPPRGCGLPGMARLLSCKSNPGLAQAQETEQSRVAGSQD